MRVECTVPSKHLLVKLYCTEQRSVINISTIFGAVDGETRCREFPKRVARVLVETVPDGEGCLQNSCRTCRGYCPNCGTDTTC